VLATDPQPQAVSYALTLPSIKAPGSQKPGAAVDLDYDLSGALAPADLLSLIGGLPHGREIARSMREKPWSPGNVQRVVYPFIHSVAPEEENNFVISGGDFERGRALFFGDQLKCSACHRIRGEGATLGPDLSNLVSRDAGSVLRDIKEPSASINPDFVAYNVTLQNGGQLTGFVRAQDERSLRLVGADGKESVFPRAGVKELRPSTVSLMPTGLLDALNEGQIRDLLTFLLNASPIRSRAEVENALASSTPRSALRPSRLEIVLVASKQDHPAHQHDYPAWQTNWHRMLASATNVMVSDAWLWPSAEQFQHAGVLLFYYWNHDWNREKLQQLDEFLERGGGIVALHSATIGNPEPDQLAGRIGLASDSLRTKYLHTSIDLKIVAPTNHPIMLGLPRQIHFLDEPYWPMVGDTNKIQVLATAEQEGSAWPMMWTFQKDKGRVFGSILGHYTWTLDDPLFRVIVLRGIAWVAGEDVDRLEALTSVQQFSNPNNE
jgi:putative heme-binding domain-containing protein